MQFTVYVFENAVCVVMQDGGCGGSEVGEEENGSTVSKGLKP